MNERSEKAYDRRTIRTKADFLMEQSWAFMRLAKKAFERGELSFGDYKYLKNRGESARHQFQKAINAMDAPTSCETCAHWHDEDCNAMERMSSYDVAMSNEGHCPRWLRIEEEEEETMEESE